MLSLRLPFQVVLNLIPADFTACRKTQNVAIPNQFLRVRKATQERSFPQPAACRAAGFPSGFKANK
jgi:hypothetical protein